MSIIETIIEKWTAGEYTSTNGEALLRLDLEDLVDEARAEQMDQLSLDLGWSE